jgi:hypothetical protein
VLIGHVDERAYADLRACVSPLPRAPLAPPRPARTTRANSRQVVSSAKGRP